MPDLKWLRRVAQALFSARRKKAVNALKQDERAGLSPEKIPAAFERLGLNPDDRGETMSVDQIIDLSNELAVS